MFALGNRLSVKIEPAVLSDLRNASTVGEKLAVLGAAGSRGSATLKDENGVSVHPGCVKPFMDGN